jgi:acyl carrier protein
MNHTATLETLSLILRGLLDDDTIVLTRDTTRDDVRGWDSFAYISFMAAVEQRFGIKFKVADIESFHTVGEIADAVERRRPA